MNITYFIGNGFDVNIGLKSSYADFYKSYVNNHPDNEPDVVTRFKNKINDCIKNESQKEDIQKFDWRDLEVALGQFTNQMNEKEAEILYLDINDSLKSYLIKEYEYFDVEAFDRSDFYNQITNPVTTQFNRITANILKNYYLNCSGDENLNIINFNYTRTIEELADFKGKRLAIGVSFTGRKAFLNSVHHIHQTLQDDEILVGVNDVSQIANPKIRDNRLLCNMYVKPNTNTLLGSGVNQDCEAIISNSDLFVVFGTSAGITDQNWWKLVCKRLVNSNARLIYFVHQSEKIHHQNLYLEEMAQEEISKLFEHAGMDLSAITENIMKRCYVSFSDTMFKLPVTYNERIKQEKTYKVGNAEATLKILDMGMRHIAVSVETIAEEAGVPSEGMWLKDFFPGYTHNSQHLMTPTIDGKEVPYDLIPIVKKDKRKDIYFEISSFIGKSNSRVLLKSTKGDLKIKALNELLKS